MKKLAFIFLFVLTGCFDDTSEIETYIADVKTNTTAFIAPMPEVPEFYHVEYSADMKRSPFVLPKPEAIQERMQQMAGCLSPDPRRRKQPLEKFALDSLTMRGTLGEAGVTWALVEAADATLYRVSEGSYLGMYHGKITAVEDNVIKLTELVPDGTGCWAERESSLLLNGSSAGE